MNASNLPSNPAASTRGTWARARADTVAQRLLLSGAAITAACLLLAYVQVCQESVEKGKRWRAEQRTLASPVVAVSHRASRL